MTGIDASMEEKVGAKPSCTKFAGILHGNAAGMLGVKWAAITGTVEVATSKWQSSEEEELQALEKTGFEQLGLTPSWKS